MYRYLMLTAAREAIGDTFPEYAQQWSKLSSNQTGNENYLPSWSSHYLASLIRLAAIYAKGGFFTDVDWKKTDPHLSEESRPYVAY